METVLDLKFAYLDRSLMKQHSIGIATLVEIFQSDKHDGTVKEGRRTWVRRISLGSQDVYLKVYRRWGLAAWVRGGWAKKRALQAYRNACQLNGLGMETAPILAVVLRDGMMEKRGSGIFLLSLSPAKTVTLYLLDHLPIQGGAEKRRGFLNELAKFLRHFHECGIYPRDFKDTNVMVRSVQGAYRFYMVDCDDILFSRSISSRRRLKNLYQLGSTLGEAMTREERLFFLLSYSQGLPSFGADFERLDSAIAKQIHERQKRRRRLSTIQAKGL